MEFFPHTGQYGDGLTDSIQDNGLLTEHLFDAAYHWWAGIVKNAYVKRRFQIKFYRKHDSIMGRSISSRTSYEKCVCPSL